MRDLVGDEAGIIVIGNKKDLNTQREVSIEEAEAYAKEFKYFYLETSALDNSDRMVEKVFETLAKDMIVRKGLDFSESTHPVEKLGERIELATPIESQNIKKSKCFCKD